MSNENHMGHEFEFRKACASDLSGILALYRQLNPEDPEISMETACKIWSESESSTAYFIATGNEAIIGSCNTYILPNLSRGGRPFALIENVIVDERYRRLLIGKELMNRAIEFAKSKNCYKIILLSSKKRTEAHRFYEAIGFNGDSKNGYEIRIDDQVR